MNRSETVEEHFFEKETVLIGPLKAFVKYDRSSTYEIGLVKNALGSYEFLAGFG